ncbi:MAG: hypothetical protein GY943_31065 [Chloroflexi bacterium]|nr:hypothetical protein [Chloroflexota bacterium]
MEYSGVWDLVSVHEMAERQRDEFSFVKLKQFGKTVDGEYRFGAQVGNIDGRILENGRVIFSFSGLDDLDDVTGAGTAVLDKDGLILTLMYHYGDDFTFQCRRQA